MIKELSQDLQWWLRSKLFLLRHVEVIHKNDVLLANGSTVYAPLDLLKLGVYRVLGLIGGCLRRKRY